MPWPVWALAITGSTSNNRPWLGAIGHHGRSRPEHLDVMHSVGIRRIFHPHQRRRHESRFVWIDPVKAWRLGPAADHLCLVGKLPNAIEGRGLLTARHHWPHADI